MKIISWNIQNLGWDKLHGYKRKRDMNHTIAYAGYGSNILEFVTRVALGNALWNAVDPYPIPVDILQIVELVCPQTAPNTEAYGWAEPCMDEIRDSMNDGIAGMGLGASYHYSYVVPRVVGGKESVGVIYNDLCLTYNSCDVLCDNMNHYLTPRSPFLTNFTLNAHPTPAWVGQQFSIAGIHAPPTGGGGLDWAYYDPIEFCLKLANVPGLSGVIPYSCVIAGDFNCGQTSTYTNGVRTYLPFTDDLPLPATRTALFSAGVGYTTRLPANSLTSLRNTVSYTGEYRSDAYDDLLYRFRPAMPPPVTEYVLDLVAGINVVGIGPQAKLNYYLEVSDHLPVVMIL